jgi:hypothetical protein
MTTLLQGARGPEALRVTLLPGTTGLNMAGIVACTLHVTRPDGTTTTWDTVLSGATQYEVVARHEFDSLGAEVAQAGAYIIEPVLEPGSRRCRLFKLHVVPHPTP